MADHLFDSVAGVGGRGVLRSIASSLVVPGPSGVAVRGRLKGVSGMDMAVLRQVGAHLAALAGQDLVRRCRAGLGHDNVAWAARKRDLTAVSSSRWAGSITKATHDQWALARRTQAAYLANLDAAVAAITRRLARCPYHWTNAPWSDARESNAVCPDPKSGGLPSPSHPFGRLR